MKRPGQLRRRRKKPVEKGPPPFTGEAWIRAVKRQPVLYSSTEPSSPRNTAGHHIIPQQTLKRSSTVYGVREWMLIWDERVGIHVSKRRHERHHSGHEPIRRQELPAAVFDFAAEFGLTWYLDRHYPKEETLEPTATRTGPGARPGGEPRQVGREAA